MDRLMLLVILGVVFLNTSRPVLGNSVEISLPRTIHKSHPAPRFQKIFNVKSFGARGDGVSFDNKAFMMAWVLACHSTTPATVLIPSGSTYLLKPIIFSGPCKSAVTVTITGTILASAERADWDDTNRSFWILFDSVKYLRVDGGGTIIGNGQVWWKISCKIDPSKPCKIAPTALTFRFCDRLMVKDLSLKDSPEMHVTFALCNNVDVSGLAISASGTSPNTDGIHVSGSTNVKISNVVIRTGDDCLSIVGDSRSIVATNIFCGPGHGISIGSLGANGIKETVSDVLIDTAQLDETTNGVRIKTWQGGRGYVRNITFRNIIMNKVMNPIIIDQNYCDSPLPCPQKKSAVAISEVTYNNFKGTSASPMIVELKCSRTVPCREIVLKDINLVALNTTSSKNAWRNIILSKDSNFFP
ncbi:polygalacturonase-like [Wolffia australiana]